MPAAAQTKYLPVNQFKVTLEGHEWDKFTDVSGLGIHIEVNANNEGGKTLTDLQPGRASMNRLTLRRHFKADPTLMEWINDVKNGKDTRKSGSVIIMNNQGKEEVRFNFFEAFPCEYHAPDLSAMTEGQLAGETIVLAYQDIEMKKA